MTREEAINKIRQWDFLNDEEMEAIETICPELKESEDEKIRKGLIEDYKKFNPMDEYLDGVPFSHVVDWLEKQKPITFNNEHIIDTALNDYCCKQYNALHNENGGVLSFARLQHLAMDIYGWCKEQAEQKPFDYEHANIQQMDFAPKQEPKFKVGDWITHNTANFVFKIINIGFNGYEVVNRENYKKTISFDNEDNYHLWTIQDAKDGDVLVCNDNPFLFSKYEKDEYGFVCCSYCGISGNKEFVVNANAKKYWCDIEFVNPATKEQRDTLFQKMYEAGYEWDEEEKELKKIEDEEYNGEDYGIDGLYHAQRILEETLGEVEGYQSDDGILEHKCAISAVKEIYERKPAWSEEDEKMLNNLIALLVTLSANTRTDSTSPNYSYPEEIDWFKSLKERMKGG